MSSFALVQPFKESTILVVFRYGTSIIRATLSKTNVIWKGETFRSEPAIDIKLPKQTGGLSEDPAKILLPLLRKAVHPDLNAMAVEISEPRACAPLHVDVIELLSSSETDVKTFYLFEGSLTKVRRNPEGRRGVVELEVDSSIKGGLRDISMGRRCDSECDLMFGKAGCGVQGASTLFSAAEAFPNQFGKVRRASVRIDIDATNLRQVNLVLDTVTHPAPQDFRIITVQPQGWWRRGYIERNGLKMTIQDWKFTQAGGTTIFTLNRIPPRSWHTQLGFLVPDCGKQLGDCTARNNSDFFGGVGRGIPPYNPALEQTGG